MSAEAVRGRAAVAGDRGLNKPNRDHTSTSYRGLTSEATAREEKTRDARSWPRYARIRGELLDLDCPITSLGWAVAPAEGGGS